jgi:hypothetical protein
VNKSNLKGQILDDIKKGEQNNSQRGNFGRYWKNYEQTKIFKDMSIEEGE